MMPARKFSNDAFIGTKQSSESCSGIGNSTNHGISSHSNKVWAACDQGGKDSCHFGIASVTGTGDIDSQPDNDVDLVLKEVVQKVKKI